MRECAIFNWALLGYTRIECPGEVFWLSDDGIGNVGEYMSFKWALMV
jgi:hypothetical protein